MHTRLTVLLSLILLLTVAVPATGEDATPQSSPMAGEFSESPSCGSGLRGLHQPKATRSGLLNTAERVYGPWAGFFGRSHAQITGSLVDFPNPFGNGVFRVHQRMQPALAQAFDQAVQSGYYWIYDGYSFAWRTIWGRRSLSQHAFGNALDVNPATNPYGDNLVTDIPPWFRQAFIDNGFCWGGQWQDVKDAMHFSWMGPSHTEGYDVRYTPYVPLTGAAGWNTLAASARIPASIAAAPWQFAADARWDGVGDLYGLSVVDGQWRIEAAGAVTGFTRVGIRYDTGVAHDPDVVPVLADTNADSRPDLWLFDTSTDPMSALVLDGASEFEVGSVVNTGLSWEDGTTIDFGHYDSDWYPDLVAVRRGATTSVEVFSASSGFATRVHDGGTVLGDTNNRLVRLGDRDVDGYADLHALDPATGQVRIVLQRSGSFTDVAADYATSAAPGSAGRVFVTDWDGDGRDDIYSVSASHLAVYLGGVPDRSIEALDDWFLAPDETIHFDAGPVCQADHCPQVGFVDGAGEWSILEAPAWQADDFSFFYGNPGDIPFMGDWDGDGIDTPGLYRQSDGFVYLRNTNTQGVADIWFYFGDPGDEPIIGDWDGDGDDTVGIYRPSVGRFYIINELGENGRGLGAAQYSFLFGDPGDKPFTGDFDGDGVTEVALHRESTGRVYYRLTLTQGVADFDFLYGNPGDVMFAADWNGDGTETLGIFRPSDGNWYIKLANGQGVADHTIHYHEHDGLSLPVVGVGHVVGEDG